jgi:hypothetical protein
MLMGFCHGGGPGLVKLGNVVTGGRLSHQAACPL